MKTGKSIVNALVLAVAAVVLCAATHIQAAVITYVGKHIGIEQDTHDVGVGWRNTTPAKPLDIDGDGIYGTDGYWFAGLQQRPTYVSSFTSLFTNNNAGAGWAAWDNPAGTADQEYPYLRDGAAGAFPDTIVQFVITGTGLDGKVLRVGCYGTVWPHTQKYTITQTVGGSASASSPVTAFSGNTMDGVFFDIIGAAAGDTFVVSIDGGGSEAMSGISFDSATATLPGIPSGLSATPGNGRVDLAWNASSDANGYEVKRSTSQGGPYSTIGSPGITSYADTTPANGTTYYYVVSAVNAFGASDDSDEVSATPSASTPPLAPTGLTATPGNGHVDLSWNASDHTDGYNVKRGTTQGGPYSAIGTTSDPSFTDTTAVNGTTYYYVVSASNAFGESPKSGEASATPVAPATITYVGYQVNVESTANDPTSGWRNPTPAKPLDLDGDNILGSDGYFAFGVSARPSYISSWGLTANFSNWSAGWGVADNPADPTGPDTLAFGRWYTPPPASVFNFVVTGDLADKVLTVGILYGTWAATGQTFELRQTVGGIASATTPGLDCDALGADVVYFNVTEAKDGDKFVVISNANTLGFTFDTYIPPPPAGTVILLR